MSNLVMDFIHGAAQMPSYFLNADIVNPVKEIAAQVTGNQQAYNNAEQAQNQTLGLGQNGTNIGSAMTKLAGNTAQAGLYAFGGEIGGAIGDTVTPVSDAVSSAVGGTAGKIAGGAVKGASTGAAFGGAGSVGYAAGTGQSVKPKNLAMDFIQGAESGAAFGGTLGAGSSALASSAKPVMAASDQIAPEDLQKMANTDNQNTIKNTLTPVTGEPVAKELAPSVATAKDPMIIKNMVDNNLNSKLAPSSPVDQLPITPTTPTSDINTPQQVNAQASQITQPTPTPEVTPDEPPKFMNAPGETTNEPTHVGKLAALKHASDIMNTGGTVDEAVNDYMTATGAKYGEAQSAISDLFGQNNPGIALDKSKVNASLNPEYERVGKMTPNATPGNSERAVINTKVIHNELNRLSTDAMDKGNQLSKNDLNLMDNSHGKTLEQLLPQAEDKQSFTDAYNSLKKYDDTVQAFASNNAEMDVPYRQSHIGQMRWANSPEEVQAAQAKRATLSNQPGWGKGRNIENYQQGRELGLTPANEGAPGIVYRDLQTDLKQKQSSLGQHILAKNLEQAYPGQTKVGDIGTDEQGNWKQLQIPYGQKISMPANIADKINARAPLPDATGGWAKYDKLNGNWKNLKLAGGGFHGLNTIGSWVGQQIGSGRIFTHPGDTGSVIKSLFSKDFMNNQVSEWDKTGATLKEDQAGLNATIHGEDTKGGLTGTEADIQPSGKLANIPGLKQIHEAVFGRQIPMMMKLMFHQQTDHLDFSDPAQLKEGVQIAKQINQQFGSFNRDIQGLTPRTAQYLNRGVLAEGWNEGQVRTLIDAIKKGGVEGKLARQTVFGKALLFGGLATAGGAMGGEFQNKTPKDIAFDILSKTINPKFQVGNYTVGLPTTQLSEAGKPILSTIQNAMSGKKVQTPIENFLSARLAAVPSGVEQIAANRNFSGNPIMGTDYYGRPISPLKSLASIAGMASPIPVAQGIQMGSGTQNLASTLANTVGVNSYQTNTMEYAPVAGQTYIAALKKTPGVTKQQIAADTTFFEALGGGDIGKSRAVKAATTAQAAGNITKAQQIIKKYDAQVAKALLPWAQNPSNTQYFDANMMQILQNTFIKPRTITSNIRYYSKTNPTAYGMPIQALTSPPVTQQQVTQ